MAQTRELIPAGLEFHGISKSFGGIPALSAVSLTAQPGECHALMGENGAGKSTLAKILAGIHRPDAGHIHINDAAVTIRNPADAAALGIGIVHQELAFCPDLSIAENLALGRFPRTAHYFLNRRAMTARAQALLAGFNLDVSRPMRELSTAQEQVVQIASALAVGARILIFDEPTASLSEREARRLFTLIETLKARRVTILYVSHRMPEVFQLCNAISVLRDGHFVGTLRKNSLQEPWFPATRDQVIQLMIGRPLAEYLPQHAPIAQPELLLDVQNLSSPGKFRNISLQVHAGEILGLAGLVGAGRSEVARAIFGLDPHATGKISIAGKPLPLRSIRKSIRAGIGLVPEDRKRQGLVLPLGGRQNFSLPILSRLSRLGFLRFHEERRLAAAYFQQLNIKTAALSAPVSTLSGGNQQKVVIAKWLAKGGRILIVDEPTRGVDVAAKTAIHHLLENLAARGVAIILISSELPEVLSVSTRTLILRDGQLAGELPRQNATQENAMRLMAGM